MIYSLYAASGSLLALVGFAIICIPILMMIATGYLGIKLCLKSKTEKFPGELKRVAISDFVIAGAGIVTLGFLFFVGSRSADQAAFASVIILFHIMLEMIMILLSWKMSRKPNSLSKPDIMINPCRCIHSMQAHYINDGECSICMCNNLRDDSND